MNGMENYRLADKIRRAERRLRFEQRRQRLDEARARIGAGCG